VSSPDSGHMLAYKRVRFGTRLPMDRVYTRSHYWLLETEPGIWRVGFTKFAIRMLGDIVEYQLEPTAGSKVAIGDKIGWIEGFKAVSDIFSVAEGVFSGVNSELREDITLLESDPYGRGWLYSVAGRPEPDGVDVHGYVSILDATIDKMLSTRHDDGAA
jgi:glycine cleavage system H protein